MAITDLSPVIERSKRAAVDRSTRAMLQLVPGIKDLPTQRASNKTFYGVLGSILALSLLAILSINIALSNDAVRIRELKLESISISESREAALRELTSLSTPKNLAQRAKELGMVKSGTPTFINLSATGEKNMGSGIKK